MQQHPHDRPPYPLALARGSGYRVWDVDGNEFIDLVNNYTSLVHGHAAPAIAEAIVAQAQLGTAFPAPGELQAELAERICQRFASIERMRFTFAALEEGVFLAPRGFMNVSTAMNEAVMGEIVDSLVPAAQRVAESTGVLI